MAAFCWFSGSAFFGGLLAGHKKLNQALPNVLDILLLISIAIGLEYDFTLPRHTVPVLLGEPLSPSDGEMNTSKWVPSEGCLGVDFVHVLPARAAASSGRDMQFFAAESQSRCNA